MDDGSNDGNASTTWDIGALPPEFVYVILGMGMLFVSTRLMKAGPSHVFALLATYLLVQQLQKRQAQSVMSFNDEMDYRLGMLGSPSHFHMDADIINLFFNMYGWRASNAYNFDNAIKAVNNILQIEKDSEKPIARCVDNYDIAYDQKNIATNLVHGFVYTIDNPLLVTKLKKALERLGNLLERHLVKIQRNCESLENAKESIDVNSRFIEDALGPKPYDGANMSQFDYY